MPLNKKRQNAIVKKATAEAQSLDLEQQEPFIKIKTETETKLNEQLDSIIADFKAELSVYLSSESGLSVYAVTHVLEEISKKIRNILQVASTELSPITNSVTQVLMCEAVAQGLKHVLACQTEQNVQLAKLAKRKEI